MSTWSDARRDLRATLGRVPLGAWLSAVRRRRRLARRLRALALTHVAGTEPEPASLAFFVVHYEAPDFLAVALRSMATHHPEAPVTVLDNGSSTASLREVEAALAACSRARLLRAHSDKSRHTVALQALFDLAVREEVETAVFLDQDAMLCRPILPLIRHLETGALLVGARDEVVLPRDDGPLRRGRLRSAPHLVHASFMLLRPRMLLDAFGPLPFAEHPVAARNAREGGWEPEPYHGLAVRAAERIHFLDGRVSDTLPPLTYWEDYGEPFACHAWYGGRTSGLSDDDTLDGLPVAWLRARRAAVLARMAASTGNARP